MATPKSLQPIPANVAITEKDGSITTFFRLAWQALITAFQFTPLVATDSSPDEGLTAAVTTTTTFTTKTSGRYRISYYMRKIFPDGVASTLQLTVGWTDGGVTQAATFALLNLDTILAEQDGTKKLRCDALTDITFAIAYTSTTPNRMKFIFDFDTEQMAA